MKKLEMGKVKNNENIKVHSPSFLIEWIEIWEKKKKEIKLPFFLKKNLVIEKNEERRTIILALIW